MEGKVFSEKSKTVLLSRHGAGIVSEYKFSPEQELIMRRMDTNKEAEVRVVGKIGAQKNKFTYGVAFLDQTLDFWGIKFPPMTESEAESRRLMLECARCHEQESVQQIDLEADVYLVNEGIVRFCKWCGSSTFWKRPSENVATEEAPPATVTAISPAAASHASPEPAIPQVATAPKPAPPPENRRKHIRTRVHFKACVRTFSFGDDVVSCEDLSRGGFCFKSRRLYSANAHVEVAAPYSPGSQNIFVAARIVYVQELKEEKVFRCGVEYTSTTETQ